MSHRYDSNHGVRTSQDPQRKPIPPEMIARKTGTSGSGGVLRQRVDPIGL